MKITVLSHDLYRFNKHIANQLLEDGHTVTYISTTDFSYQYKSIFHKFQNAFTKTFLKKNIKKKALNQYVLNFFRQHNMQDCTLVIDPAHFNFEILKHVRQCSDQMIAYNYDSTTILKIPKELLSFFDYIYSFDKKDCETYGFRFITNFNYFSKHKPLPQYKLKAFSIQSLSQDRIHTLSKIANELVKLRYSDFLFIIYGKKIEGACKQIEFRSSRTDFHDVQSLFENSEIIVDLVRDHQLGLSFRFFEAMAYQKKVITTNKDVATYDFYHPNNILIVDRDRPVISAEFLENQYQPIDEAIYEKYTLQNWIQTVIYQNINSQSLPLKNKTMKSSIVSVIIPMYNCENTLTHTVQSVLNQTYDAIQIILVNDGSTDATEEVAKELLQHHPNIEYHSHENKGQTKTRNIGASLAKGHYLLFLDSDDTIAPTFIEKSIDVLEKNPEVKIVYSQSEFSGTKSGRWNLPAYHFKSFLLNNCIPITALIRQNEFEQVGGFDESLTFYEDWELWIQLVATGGKVHQIQEPLFYYYQHERPLSVTGVAKQNRSILSENKLAIYTKHYALYAQNGYDFETILKAFPYQEKYYNLWFKKIFYAFKKKKK